MNILDNYIVFHTHQRGYDHIARERGCEDYSIAGDNDNCVYAIVCDGHGGALHFRSQLGAKFCAEAIEECLKGFSEQVNGNVFKRNPRKILEDLIESIIFTWLQKVDNHFENTAIPVGNTSKDEPRWDLMSQEEQSTFQKNIDDESWKLQKYTAYGTTFKFSCVMRDFWFCAQLGDGTTCYLRNGKYAVADTLINDSLKEWKKNRATEHLTTSTCTYYQTKDHYVCYDYGLDGCETPDMFLCLTDGIDGAKAMNLMSDGECKKDEIFSDYLGNKSALYFQFVRNQILQTVCSTYQKIKNKFKNKLELETELNNVLGENIKTLCNTDFHYHDDIGIAGIVKINKKGDQK